MTQFGNPGRSKSICDAQPPQMIFPSLRLVSLQGPRVASKELKDASRQTPRLRIAALGTHLRSSFAGALDA